MPLKCPFLVNEEFNDYTSKLGKVVEDVWKSKAGSFSSQQMALFNGRDACLEKVNIARTGDHGPHIIQQAKAVLNSQGIDVKVMDLGENPIKPGNHWETVDWEAASRAPSPVILKREVDAAIKKI